MESEPSWLMLALALGLVLALTGVAVWLSLTEVRAVTPAPATVRPGRRALRRGSTDGDGGTAPAEDERGGAG